MQALLTVLAILILTFNTFLNVIEVKELDLQIQSLQQQVQVLLTKAGENHE